MQGKVEICGVNTSRLKVLKSSETRELLIKSHEEMCIRDRAGTQRQADGGYRNRPCLSAHLVD